MRVFIADRNARLLESISRTFSHEFTIQTGTTLERCNDLLLRGEFDLVVVSEKLADGPGLHLLGQIARNSPNTLRVFSARASRLELLKGKLGPFGLFRTLTYPIDPQKLLSALTLARTGLQVDWPAQETREVPPVERQASRCSSKRKTGSPPAEVPHARAPTPAPPQRASAPTPAPVQRASAPTSAPLQYASTPTPAPAQPASIPTPVVATVRPTIERIWLTSTDAMFATNVPVTIASMKRVPPSNVSSAPLHSPVAQQTQLPAPRPEPAPIVAIRPHVSRPQGSWSSQPRGEFNTPMRSKLVIGATVAVVFLVTKLTLSLAEVHVTEVSAVPRPVRQQPDLSAPAPNFPSFSPTPAPVAQQRPEPKPSEAPPNVESAEPQVATNTAPIADPSTFGSEAYEPTSSN